MPPRRRTRRAAPKAVAVDEVILTPDDIEIVEVAELEAAPKAASFVSEPPSCAMTERKWRGQYPVWQCRKCRVDTLDPGLAEAARRACRK